MPRHPWAVSEALCGSTYLAVPGYTLIADQGSQASNEALVESVEQLFAELQADPAGHDSALSRASLIQN